MDPQRKRVPAAVSPIQWFGYVDGSGYAVPNERWTFDHGSVDPLEGWTVEDLTTNDFTAWSRITDADWTSHGNPGTAPVLSGIASAWVGFHQDQADAACWVGGVGYGDSWCQEYVSPSFTYDGSGTVDLTFNYFSDLEADFDYLFVLVRIPSLGVEAVMDSITGVNGTPAAPAAYGRSITELETMTGALPTNFQIVLQLKSDGGYSDHDGLYSTAVGPFAVDDIVIQGNLVDAGPKVYWADSGASRIQRSNVYGGQVEDIITGENAVGLALDVAADRMYWSTGTTLRSARLDGTLTATIFPAGLLESVDAMALDAAGGRIFFVGAASGGWDTGIWRVNLDGSGASFLIPAEGVQGIALDVADGKVYWTQSNMVRRANMDGTSPETLVSGLTSAGGIGLDLSARNIYWSDAGTGKLQRANMDGTAVVVDLLTGLASPKGVGVDVLTGKVFWTDTATPAIQRANLDGTNPEAIVSAGLSIPADIAASELPVGPPNSSFVLDFETGDEGFTASACDPIGDFVAVNPVSNYTIADTTCSLEGNVLSLHDGTNQHPAGQRVRLTSPTVDVSGMGPGKNVFAEYDIYTDQPLNDGVFYKPTWVFYPYTCPVSGDVGWSDPVPTNVAMYASNPHCSRIRHFATETTDGSLFPVAIPDHADSVRFVLEVWQDCGVQVIPPGGCSGVSNFSPLFDNVRIGVTGSNIVHVPSFDHRTIQAAIDSAAVADTVLVAPGTYTGDGNRDLEFGGKDIVLMSEEGAARTIIDCQGTAGSLHRGFWLIGGESNAAVIQGITVKNGFHLDGGGMLFEAGATPTIRECVLLGNQAIYGGGIRASIQIAIFDSKFEDNRAEDSGGGLYFYGDSISLTNCTFQSNILLSDLSSAYYGAGANILLQGSGTCQIQECDITANKVVDPLDASVEGVGLNIRGDNSTISISRSRIVGNKIEGVGFGSNSIMGVGVKIGGYRSSYTIAECVIAGNFVSGTFVLPTRSVQGVGLAALASGTISRSTVTANVGPASIPSFGGGIHVFQGRTLSITESIVWGNCAQTGREIYSDNAVVDLACSDVDSSLAGVVGVTYGANNIFTDPLFCGPADCSGAGSVTDDYTLAADSPCLPVNNSCGIQMGALGEACPRIGPDPDFSQCVFPGSLPACPEAVQIQVTVLNGTQEAVPNCNTIVELVPETGAELDPGQLTQVSGLTDVNGVASLEFPCGIGGSGTVHFEVFCDSIPLCTSGSFTLVSSCKAGPFGGTIETVDSAGDVGSQLALALDANDRPHVSYYDAGNNGDLKYATRDAGVWSVETISSGPNDDGNVTSIAVDNGGRVHVSHYDQTNSTLKYITKVGGTWQPEVDVDVMANPGAFGRGTAIASYLGDPRIAYYDVAGVGVKYALWTGIDWSITYLNVSYMVLDIDLAMDDAGYGHILFTTSNGQLRYALHTDTGFSGGSEIVSPVGTLGLAVSIALDASGKPHIAFVGQEGELLYGIRDAGVWSFEVVHCGIADFPSLALGDGDVPWISYKDRERPGLTLAHKEPGTWVHEFVEDMGAGHFTGTNTAIALSSGDLPQVAFYDATGKELRFAGVFNTEPAVATGAVIASPASVVRSGTNSTTISADFSDVDNHPVSEFTISIRVREPDNATVLTLVDQQSSGSGGLLITGDGSGNYTASFVWDPGDNQTIGAYDLQFEVSDGVAPLVTDAFTDNLDDLIITSIFTDVTVAVLGGADNQVNGVFWPDYDDDGDPDLYLTRSGVARLYENNAGVLTLATPAALALTGAGDAAWADYDNDGDMDVYLVVSYQANRLFRNDGGDVYVDVAAGTPMAETGSNAAVSWTDMDLDGDLDLILALPFSAAGDDMIYRNDGGDNFTGLPLPGPASLNSRDVAWGDFDRDGDQDCFIANLGSARSQLLENIGGGNFVNLIDPGGSSGLSHVSVQTLRVGSWGDYDGDGLLDLYLGKWSNGPNMLFRNVGDGSFQDVTTSPLDDAGNANASTWGDIDLDGDLDLFLANWGGEDPLFLNLGGGSFERESVGAPDDSTASTSAAMADFDGDGDLDLMVGRQTGVGARLYRNDSSQGRHWLHVDLVGTRSSRTPMGARVRVVSGSLTQERELGDDAGGPGKNSLTLEFGLGMETLVDSLIVIWPSGAVQDTQMVATDQRLLIVERGGVTSVERDEGVPARYALYANSPNPFNPITTIRFDLPRSGPVTLEIFDVTGRRIRTIMRGEDLPAGRYDRQWKGHDEQGRRVASGVYLYRLVAADFIKTKKMTLVK